MSEVSTDVMANIQAQPTKATLAAVDGGWVLTMSRDFTHPVERLWEMVTDPDLLKLWSPVVPDRPLSRVGPATSRETPTTAAVDVEVLVADAPHLLVHRWGPHTLRWTIDPSGNGCQLTLEHTFHDPGERGMYAAGWHVCFAVLRAVTDGRAVERVVGQRAGDYGWSALRDRYDVLLRV